MEKTDSIRCCIDAMINLRHPLAVLAPRLPWSAIEAHLAPKFERRDSPSSTWDGHFLRRSGGKKSLSDEDLDILESALPSS